MPATLLTKNNQADGHFNYGAILEKKPVVPSNEGKGFKPYSNLFYWAHAWSENGSTIGEHPHQGFEILSFVMKGGIEHYDSSNKKWIPLHEGDVQIIRSGSGISHSEKILPGSSMFQIWFDPELQKSIHKNASYNDYPSSAFPVISEKGITSKILKGIASPLEMDTPGVGIRQLTFGNGIYQMQLDSSKVYSLFVVEGDVSINENKLVAEDFIRIDAEKVLDIVSEGNAKIFMIDTPQNPGYPTYAMMYL